MSIWRGATVQAKADIELTLYHPKDYDNHPSRIEAGIVFALNEMIDEGHVFVPRETLAQ